jgi:acyl-CoA dehydrogenase
MCFELSEESKAIQRLMRSLVERYAAPMEAKLLREEEITVEERRVARNAVVEVGLMNADLSTINNVVVTEENSRYLVSLPLREDPGEVDAPDYGKPRWPVAFLQTEPSGGSDPGNNMQTTAVRDGDNWIINGAKTFITGAATADEMLIMAVTDPQKRQHGGITQFRIPRDTPGVTIGRKIRVLGRENNQLGPYEVFLDNVVVPHSAVVGQVGAGFRIAQGMLSNARMNIGARAVGIAQRCYDMMVEHVKDRVLFGTPLAEKQAIQSMIVDTYVDVHTTRLLVYDAACKNDRGQDTRVEAGLVKFIGSEMVGRVVDRAIQVHGGYGVTYDLPFAHWYTSLRPMRVYEGPTEVQKFQVVARHLLRR